MTPKQLKQLSRAELLELLLSQSRENEALKAKVDQLEQALDDKTIRINQAGSIAEAALRLNGMFEAAEASCAQYVDNIRRLDARQAEVREEMLAQTRGECQQMKDQAERECRQLREETERSVEQQWSQISTRLTDLYASHQGLMELVNQGVNLAPRGGAGHGKENY